MAAARGAAEPTCEPAAARPRRANAAHSNAPHAASNIPPSTTITALSTDARTATVDAVSTMIAIADAGTIAFHGAGSPMNCSSAMFVNSTIPNATAANGTQRGRRIQLTIAG